MSHDSDNGKHHGATTVRASKDEGGGGKWLLGALAAVVLVGGGYFVWKSMAPGQTDTQTAYNDTYDSNSDSLRAGPMGPADYDGLRADAASTDDSVAEPAATVAPRSTTARRSTARSETVPEETIGVMQTSADDPDAIIVTPPQRAVWTRVPSARRLERLYPARALERGREGEARLHCTVVEDGALDCVKVEETPGGFGNAAMRVARTLRHAPQRADGSDAVGAPVNLRVVFRLEDEERSRFGRG